MPTRGRNLPYMLSAHFFPICVEGGGGVVQGPGLPAGGGEMATRGHAPPPHPLHSLFPTSSESSSQSNPLQVGSLMNGLTKSSNDRINTQ